MRRRKVLGVLAGAAAFPFAARAQQGGARPRLAWVHPSARVSDMREDGSDAVYRAFPEELRRLGYVDGANLVIERYSGESRRDGYAELARIVVQSQPTIIFTSSTDMTRLVTAETTTIPIVAVLTDPVATGLISNLAHPSGNLTGASVDAGIQIWSKRLALLKEVLPSASRVGFLSARSYWEAAGKSGEASRAAAAKLGLTLVGCLLSETMQEAEYRRVFGAMPQDRLDALMVSEQAEHRVNRKLIVELTGEARLAAMFSYRDFAELGGLMAYAVDLADAFRQGARQVDQILKGARPSDIPFYQQTRFELLINLKTAKTLGITMPATLLGSADEVIE
jgi:putative ABC transport system substrate-binding protein